MRGLGSYNCAFSASADFTFRPIFPLFTLNGWMGGPYNRSGCFVEERNHLSYPEIEPRSLRRIAPQTAKIPPVLIFCLGVARHPQTKRGMARVVDRGIHSDRRGNL